MSRKKHSIGIDLGTSTTGMAYHDGKNVIFLSAPSGRDLMPSIAAVNPDGEIVVGERAAKALLKSGDPKFVYSNIKRHIGVPFNEDETHDFQIAADENGNEAFIGPEGRLYSPTELSAEILKVMKAEAERRLGLSVTGAVITVPAYFSQTRKAATAEAGKLAGFETVTLLSEPEAGAIAHGMDKGNDYSRVAVADLGGGTFDFVVMDVGKGVFTELDKNGSEYLGGIDWDNRLRDMIVKQYPSIETQRYSMLKLAPATQAGKEDLSTEPATTISLPLAVWNEDTNKMDDIEVDVSLAEFEEMTKGLVDRVMELIDQTLKRIDCESWKIDDVVLVGGMTRVPALRKAIRDYFPSARLQERISADKAVAIGAAFKAAELDKRLVRRVHHESVSAMSIGIEGQNDEFVTLIERGCSYGELRSLSLTNAENGQTLLPIALLEGDSDKASENTLVAWYIHQITPVEARKGKVTIEGMLDSEGMLMMTGRDEVSGEVFEAKGQV